MMHIDQMLLIRCCLVCQHESAGHHSALTPALPEMKREACRCWGAVFGHPTALYLHAQSAEWQRRLTRIRVLWTANSNLHA